MTRIIRVAGVQHERIAGAVDENLARVNKWVRDAAAQGAQIIGLPELANTGYICGGVDDSHFSLAEHIPGGRTTDFFISLAKELNVFIIGGLYEHDPISHIYYNSSVVVGPEGLIGLYRKTHIASKPTFLEKYYFAPGNLGYPVFDLGICRIGMTICYDRHFPECYRHLALNGAEIVFSITNTGSPNSIRMWDSIMSCNAYCNGMFVVQVNACGKDGPNTMHGRSSVVSPMGEFLSQLDASEGILVADCDLDAIAAARRNLGSTRDVILGDFGLSHSDTAAVSRLKRLGV